MALRATYAYADWATQRILDELDNDTLYTDSIVQVRMPTWHHGRIAVLGDAA